ncbi:hypothetical protein NFI96_008496, partial [Prochilodus magdalenae]
FEQTLSAVRSEVKEFKETLGSLTEAVSAHDARIDSLESALKKMEGVNTALQQKIEDLEGRSRRNNIRIIGVPEGAEGTRPTDFVAELLPKLLGEENFNLPLVVDRAHRSLQPRPADGARARPIIARIHLFQVKEKIMQLQRLHGPLQFRSNKCTEEISQEAIGASVQGVSLPREPLPLWVTTVSIDALHLVGDASAMSIRMKSLDLLSDPTLVQLVLGSSWCTTMPGLMWREYAGSSWTIDWPTGSPDLNPVEHLWDIMFRSIALQTVQELSDALVQIWEEIPQDTIRCQFRLPSEQRYTVLELPYLDRSLSLLVVLPSDRKTPLSQLEAQLTGHAVALWDTGLRRTKMDVFIPRFKMHTRVNIKPVLRSLGISDAFDPSSADFRGISDMEALYVSEAFHEAKMEVTEDGTRAAAATGGNLRQAFNRR